VYVTQQDIQDVRRLVFNRLWFRVITGDDTNWCAGGGNFGDPILTVTTVGLGVHVFVSPTGLWVSVDGAHCRPLGTPCSIITSPALCCTGFGTGSNSLRNSISGEGTFLGVGKSLEDGDPFCWEWSEKTMGEGIGGTGDPLGSVSPHRGMGEPWFGSNEGCSPTGVDALSSALTIVSWGGGITTEFRHRGFLQRFLSLWYHDGSEARGRDISVNKYYLLQARLELLKKGKRISFKQKRKKSTQKCAIYLIYIYRI
ncbi:MAG: hypothetical protein ACRDC4_02895, partial [Plesiomonas sp.]